MKEFISLSDSDKSKRLDILLAEKTGVTRSQIQKLIREGYILVNNSKTTQSYKAQIDDIITLFRPEQNNDLLIPEPLSIKVHYMDDYLIVVDKPADMVVYPSVGHKRGTLLNAVFYHTKKLSSIGAPLRNGVVHRLDKDTSGLIVVATNDESYYGLIEQFKRRTIKRKYTAIVYGSLKNESGRIDYEIGRSLKDRKKMSIRTKKGKEAITYWSVLKRFKLASLIEAVLGSGRTHQIRVHFSSIGHPVLGDKVYGKKTTIIYDKKMINFPRQMLHAVTLGFYHPIKNEYMEFTSPLPEDFLKCIKMLEEATIGE